MVSPLTSVWHFGFAVLLITAAGYAQQPAADDLRNGKRTNIVIADDSIASAADRSGLYCLSGATIQYIKMPTAEYTELDSRNWADVNLSFDQNVGVISPNFLVYSQGYLYVNDPEGHDLIVVDVSSMHARKLYAYAHEYRIDTLAVAGDLLALGDSSKGYAQVLDKRNGLQLSSQRLPFVGRLAIDSKRLVYLDRTSTKFVSVSLSDLGLESDRDVAIFSDDDLAAIGQIQSFALDHGSLLFTTRTAGLFLYILSTHKLFRIPASISEGNTQISLGTSHMALWGPRTASVNLESRPVPVAVSITGSAPARTEALRQLYVELAKLDRLETVSTVVSDSYKSIEEFITTTPLISSQPALSTLPKGLRADLALVLCRLNPGLCNGTEPSGILTKRVQPGLTMRIPVTGLATFPTFINLAVQKKDVQSLLESHSVASIPSEYNSPPVGTIENILQQNDLVFLKNQHADLRAGDVVTLSSVGYPEKVGTLRPTCFERSSQTTPFVSFAETTNARDYSSLVSDHAEQFGENSRLLFSFEEPAWEHIDLTQPTDEQCITTVVRNTYVVTDVVRTKSATLKFVGRVINPEVLNNKFLDPHRDESDTGKVRIAKPFTIAFRARAIFQPERGQTQDAGTDAIVEAQREAWVKASGVVTLPSDGWLLTAWLYYADLKPDSQVTRIVHDLAPSDPTLSVRVIPSFPISSVPEGISERHEIAEIPGSSPSWSNEFLANRKEQLQRIHYAAPEHANYSGVAIGLADRIAATLSRTHPDLEGAHWLETTGGEAHDCPTLEENEKIIDAKDDNEDHATFIAALLVGQCAPDVGLIPEVPIYAFDTDYPSLMFPDLVEKLKQKRMWIINASTLLPSNPQVIEKLSLLSASQENWSRSLIVVASGNQGKRLPDEWTPLFPLNYLAQTAEFPHIIGVGAVDEKSNFGLAYVQLVAPGRTLVSAARNGGHVRDSGSSFAAPQVTAAAAMLAAQGLVDAALIKARLIYTSDPVFDVPWGQNLWGGLLNVKRAVFSPDENLLILPGDPDTQFSVRLKTPEARVDFEDEQEISYLKLSHKAHSVAFSQILRIIHFVNPDRTAKFLVVYLSSHGSETADFRMAWVRRLHGSIQYLRLTRGSVSERQSEKMHEGVVHNMDVGDIQDYTAGIQSLRETQVSF
jgi:hypothetical protein